MSGAERIAAERKRQIDVEGYTAEHDDLYVNGEFALAAACYAVNDHESCVVMDAGTLEDGFPWEPKFDKRDEVDQIRLLEMAGALIAAEIDRRLRLKAKKEEETQ